MRIYDISRELFSCPPYPGDPKPWHEPLARIETGDGANVTGFYAGTHSATHADAPLHYFPDGQGIGELPPIHFIGPCSVFTVKGLLTGKDMERLLEKSQRHILLHGNGQAFLSQSAAFTLAEAGILLVGTDAPSIGMYENEEQPHKELLGAGIPILESLDLQGIREGDYFLSALPLKMEHMDAAPVRAVLLEA